MALATGLATAQFDSADTGHVCLRATAKSRNPSTRAATNVGIGHWLLALVDQALVSGTRFLATIIVGRFCGPGELGTYSLAFSLLVLAGCFQEALITTPYAIFSQRLRSQSKASYAGALAWMHFQVVIGSAALLVTLALVGFALQAESFGMVVLVLALTLPASLMADFARRFALANLEVKWAAGLDAAIAGLQLVSLLLLAQAEWLSAPVALLAVAAACLLPILIWWMVAARSRMQSARSIAPYWARSWSLGRWLLASQVTAAFHGLMPVWLLTVLVDARATGQFVACLNLALLANPLIFAIGNLLMPRAAQALARGGPLSVQRVVFRVASFLVPLMAGFAIALTWRGQRLIEWIYGHSFAGAERVPGLLGLTAMAWAISATCGSGTAALGRPRWGFFASGIGTIVSAICIVLFAPFFKVTGASLGLLLGSATAAAVHLWAFIRFSGGLRLKNLSTTEPVYDSGLVPQDLINA